MYYKVQFDFEGMHGIIVSDFSLHRIKKIQLPSSGKELCGREISAFVRTLSID